ncbi:MAG: nucleotidyltransferase family protein [Candidatus Hydrogenedentes bacterium]|nr:nucleotidyltransferase family protein [Candidatus Hydrogenedentota bacterium]
MNSPDDAWRPELLYLLARATGGALERPPVALDDAGWRAVIQAAAAHRLIPLLHEGIRGLDGVPAAVLRVLHRGHLKCAALNTGIAHQLAQVAQGLDGAAVDFVLIKGLYLSAEIYGTLASRPTSDVDILVHREDMERADRCLAELGYALSGGRAWQEAHHFHAVYRHPSFKTCLELHWHVSPPDSPFKIDVADLWAGARRVTIGGRAVRVLSPEHTLIHLAIHGAYQHAYQEGLRVLCDVAMCVKRYEDEMDWAAVAAVARSWRAEKCTALTLSLAGALLGTPLAQTDLDGLCPRSAYEEQIAVAEQIVFQEKAVSRKVAAFWNAKGLRARLRILAQHVFLPRDVLAMLYEAPREGVVIFLYYPVLWKDLLMRHGGKILGVARGDAASRAAMDGAQRRNDLLGWFRS